MHLETQKDPIIANAAQIVAAIRDDIKDSQHLIIAISGDITYCGTKGQFEVANHLIKFLNQAIAPSGEISITVVTCPGNHDCDFSNKEDADLRERLLSTLRGPDRLEMTGRTGDEILKPQAMYFMFMENLTGIKRVSFSDKMLLRQIITIGERQIVVRCINTAWMSRMDEEQGSLLFPLEHLPNETETSDYSLSIFHHPYNWINADNKIAFKEYVDRVSDLVVTGHEHVASNGTVSNSSGHHFEFLEGGCLQKSAKQLGKSQFNLVQINLEERTQRVVQYTWDKDIYLPVVTRDWSQFQRSRNVERNKFLLSDSALEYLRDPGMPINHPVCGKLSLDQIFVFPYLKRMDIGVTKPKAQSQRLEQIQDDKILDFITKNKYVVFTGEEKSGKTCLAKRLALAAHTAGIIPVIIDARQVKGNDPIKAMDRILESSFKEQYAKDLYQYFIQLDPDRRLIIIDDFTKSGCNSKGRSQLLEDLKKKFSRIFIFGGDLFQLEEVFGEKTSHQSLKDFITCSIAEFGHFHRAEIVKKWILLGQERVLEASDMDHACRKMIKTIDSILGKNVIPSHPVFILSILQTSDSTAVNQVNHGSHGYFFEALLTGLLKTDVNLKYKYLSEIAYHLFCAEHDFLTTQELDAIGESYHNEYGTRIDRDAMISSLCESNILQRTGQTVRFRYRYGRYYFSARYISTALQENVPGNRAREDILKLSKALHRDDYSNIMLFLNYLSRDPSIVEAVLANAATIYSDHALCRLEKDIDFANKICTSIPVIELADDVGDASRERELRIQDYENEVKYDENSPEVEASLEEIRKINNAFKTIKIMGQTVRNFADTTRAQTKVRIVKECFALGLRTMQSVTQLFEQNLDRAKEDFFQLAMSRFPNLKPDEARGAVDRFLYFLMQIMAYGVIKTVSHAVGSEKLSDTYHEVIASGMDFTSARFIDLSIKMDHLRNTPVEDIYEMHKRVKDHEFNLNLLRTFVAEHFTLYHCKDNVRAEVCSEIGINAEKQFLAGPLKKTSPQAH